MLRFEWFTHFIRPGGLSLSFLAFLLLGYVCFHLRRRRERLRGWRVGPLSLRSGGVRWAWTAILIGGFMAGLHGVPIATRTGMTAGDAADPPPSERIVRTSSTLRLPFYVRHAREERGIEGRSYGRRTTETLQLPWAFLLAVITYGLLQGASREAALREAAREAPSDAFEHETEGRSE